MTTFTVKIAASKAGSIGSKYCERREYEVEALDADHAIIPAIDCAYRDGLEHVLVTHINGVRTAGSKAE